MTEKKKDVASSKLTDQLNGLEDAVQDAADKQAVWDDLQAKVDVARADYEKAAQAVAAMQADLKAKIAGLFPAPLPSDGRVRQS